MSDPVTNVDVEDVLSSIRRLVSDTNADHRAAPRPEQEPANSADISDAEPKDSKPAEALILTSALRVNVPSKDASANVSNAEMPNFRHVVADEGDDDAAHEATSTEAEHVDWAALADDDYYEDDEPAAETPVIDFIRHNRNVDTKPEAATADGSEDADFEDDNDDAEAALEWAVYDDEDDDDDADDTALSVEEEGDDEAGLAADDDADDDHVTAEHVLDEPEEEVVLEDGSHTFEEDDAHLDEEVIFASAAAASVIDEADDHDDDALPDIDLADFNESVIDEDTLRDLVAEIVRQELTGELGERITRNVRKLVRREIHRALMTREFE